MITVHQVQHIQKDYKQIQNIDSVNIFNNEECVFHSKEIQVIKHLISVTCYLKVEKPIRSGALKTIIKFNNNVKWKFMIIHREKKQTNMK